MIGVVARRLLVALLVVIAAGFVAFADRVSGLADRQNQSESADAIVALTGGGGARIAEAIELLRRDAGARLLISGVHEDTSLEDLRRLAGALPGDDALFDCCVDLDRRSRSTFDNAAQTAAWARGRGYRSLIVVTSDFHMPRALLVLRGAMGDIELRPHAVPRAASGGAPWWRDPRDLRRLAVEYAKFLVILGREAVRAPGPREETDVASAP